MSNEWVVIPEWPKDGAKVEFYIYRKDPIIGIFKQNYFFEDKDPIHPTHIKRWRYIEEPKKETAWKKLDPDNLPKCPVLIRAADEWSAAVATSEPELSYFAHRYCPPRFNPKYCEIPE